MVCLTVVTTIGLIGVTVTGFFGMNLFALAESPLPDKIFYFLRRLSDFLETLADERQSSRAKLAALVNVWKRERDQNKPPH